MMAGGYENLTNALALWRGPAWAEFAGQAWAQAAIARLEELRLTALEARIEADLEQGRHVEIVAELESQVEHVPCGSGCAPSSLSPSIAAAARPTRWRLPVGPARAHATSRDRPLSGDARAQASDLAPGSRGRAPTEPTAPQRSILVAVRDLENLPGLLALAEAMAHYRQREVILARPILPGAEFARRPPAWTPLAIGSRRRGCDPGRGVHVAGGGDGSRALRRRSGGRPRAGGRVRKLDRRCRADRAAGAGGLRRRGGDRG